MTNTNLSMVKELQEQLTEDFTVTQDARGDISIYSNIEEYYLNQDEVQILLQEAELKHEDLAVKYWIIDEVGNYVHANSIKKVSTEYTYVSYPKLYITYTSIERATEALECLNLHNSIGNLGHSFAIMEGSKSKVNEEKFYLTIDQDGYFDGQIYLSKGDGTETEITYLAEKYSHHANGDIRRAVASIQKLNELASELGIEGYTWHLKEVTKQEWTELANHEEKQEYSRPTWTIPKGKIGTTKKLVKDIYKKYDVINSELEIEWQANLNKKVV